MSPARRRGPDLPYRLLAGVVPARGGWLVASGKLVGITLFPEEPKVVPLLADVMDTIPAYDVIALAMAIGLPDAPMPGGRQCDREARRLLGWPRQASILPPPCRAAVHARTYDQARRLNGGHLSPATWRQMPRLAEVERTVLSYQQRTIYEVSAELTYFQLDDEVPVKHPKRTELGIDERSALLVRRLPGLRKPLDTVLPGVPRWQLVDACAALWTSRRIAARAVMRLPETPEWNAEGLRMEIVR